ncbi:MAG: hypothetical protein HG466_003680 [Prevotella sp.]|jgi:hypothetical protein|uniref:DUF6706 family protein n=1 Tax=uncultured Prevotella sp. TaxID=159272 RepID=UPI0017DDAC78|nr:DUF6706 family protein [uncultured Prevotella sp.]MBB1529790.1 hypothetical protein [Prevotella sp.]DAF21867.1 MAG TPA: hypothetical protein [Caudoviricetes sp.]DAN60718.1 MAG TPA: hypothetical protein [Bacteriophage sp.]DAK41297.1 MAG TPA: hypothetical protein [Caudoviricetes sp.]DAS26299.1 MAG TPA: hypothetical protein [Caudoviricetes sp.]
MNVRDYISSKFQSFGIQVSEADLLDMSLNARVNIEDDVDADVIDNISVAIARFIPSLLLRPTSINESGFSMSWNTQGVKDYYSLLCKKYGLKDELNDNKPKIRIL